MSRSIVYPFMTRMELHEPFPLNEVNPQAGYLTDDSMSALFTRNVFSTVFLTVLKWVKCMPLLLLFTHDVKIRQKDQKCRLTKMAKNVLLPRLSVSVGVCPTSVVIVTVTLTCFHFHPASQHKNKDNCSDN